MKVLLVAANYYGIKYDFEESIAELKELAKACDMEVTGVITQKIEKKTPQYYIGKGKVSEIKEILEDEDEVIFNEELSPLQVRNLSDAFEREVSDRSDLILKIFETRAKTREAKLQVEIARANYMLPRLAGQREDMYSQQGGSGFRGSGEKQIEVDRRNIRNQISNYQKELDELVANRETQRRKRNKKDMKIISLVGYTNSGKSSLLNYFSDKQVFEKDMLFATLETSTRQIEINSHPVLMNDTVGFISQLPHHLIKAFRSTLEEIKEADLLLEVIDASSHYVEQHIETTAQVLEQLGVKDIPIIYVYNKMDKVDDSFIASANPSVLVSVKEEDNLDQLEDMISLELFKDYQMVELYIPYSEGSDYQYLKLNYDLEETFMDNAIKVVLSLSPSDYHRFMKYQQNIN